MCSTADEKELRTGIVCWFWDLPHGLVITGGLFESKIGKDLVLHLQQMHPQTIYL